MFLNKKISVLFLVHNEVETIEREIVAVKKNLDGFINYEIIIMQDGSSDGTFEKLEQIKEKYNLKLNSIKDRDSKDKSRKESPLIKTEESIFLDTTLIDEKQVFEIALK